MHEFNTYRAVVLKKYKTIPQRNIHVNLRLGRTDAESRKQDVQESQTRYSPATACFFFNARGKRPAGLLDVA